jgi:hypothetical protein
VKPALSFLILLAGVISAQDASAPATIPLPEVKTVYCLPMQNGLDQYLAQRLVATGMFRVVTDPDKAEAVFADRLGKAFEMRMAELYPPPPPPKEEKQEDAKDKDKEGDAEPSVVTMTIPSASQMTHIPTMGGGKGNLFLVDRRSREVIWSTHRLPNKTTPQALDSLAQQITRDLKATLKAKR